MHECRHVDVAIKHLYLVRWSCRGVAFAINRSHEMDQIQMNAWSCSCTKWAWPCGHLIHVMGPRHSLRGRGVAHKILLTNASISLWLVRVQWARWLPGWCRRREVRHATHFAWRQGLSSTGKWQIHNLFGFSWSLPYPPLLELFLYIVFAAS